MRIYGKSRCERFGELDRPALRVLPATRFEHAEWKNVRVNIDYHVELEPTMRGILVQGSGLGPAPTTACRWTRHSWASRADK